MLEFYPRLATPFENMKWHLSALVFRPEYDTKYIREFLKRNRLPYLRIGRWHKDKEYHYVKLALTSDEGKLHSEFTDTVGILKYRGYPLKSEEERREIMEANDRLQRLSENKKNYEEFMNIIESEINKILESEEERIRFPNK